MRTASAVSVYVTKNPRTAPIPCVSANGATKVDTAAAARLPTASTPITIGAAARRARLRRGGRRRRFATPRPWAAAGRTTRRPARRPRQNQEQRPRAEPRRDRLGHGRSERAGRQRHRAVETDAVPEANGRRDVGDQRHAGRERQRPGDALHAAQHGRQRARAVDEHEAERRRAQQRTCRAPSCGGSRAASRSARSAGSSPGSRRRTRP